jgi:plastocyanin
MTRRSPSRRLGLAALLFAGVGALLGGGYALAAAFTITLGATGPSPGVQTAAWGDSITWTNGDTVAHSVESSRGAFTSESIPPGGAYTHTYTTRGVGNYSYRQIGPKKSYSGTIVITLSGTVSLKASKATVTYGQPVVLSGSSTVLGFPVTVAQRPVGGGSWVDLGSFPVGSDGAFSTTITPKAGARYRATAAAGQLMSGQVPVAVAPVVTLKASNSKPKPGTTLRLVTHVTPATAAHSVSLFVYVPSRRRWVRSVGPVNVRNGVATFRWKAVPGRTLLRSWLTNADLEPGFAPAFSKSVLVKSPAKR